MAKTAFWSTEVRPGFWVALGVTVVFAVGFFLGYAVPR